MEAAKKVSAVERAQGDHEKHGQFTGRYVVNPINGEKVPVWVADYVVADYGTGAVMAVPLRRSARLRVRAQVRPSHHSHHLRRDDPLFEQLKDEQGRVVTAVEWERAMEAEGTLVQSGKYTGMTGGKHSEGESAIVADLEERGVGRRKVEFRLRDWLISRQRYWGNPIPAVHCEHCGVVPVPADQLPVRLPEDIDLAAGETLATHEGFVATTCPVCGAPRASRDGHHGHVHVLELVLHALHRSAQRRGSVRSREGERVDAGRPVHRRHQARHPASALQPLLHEGAAR